MPYICFGVQLSIALSNSAGRPSTIHGSGPETEYPLFAVGILPAVRFGFSSLRQITNILFTCCYKSLSGRSRQNDGSVYARPDLQTRPREYMDVRPGMIYRKKLPVKNETAAARCGGRLSGHLSGQRRQKPPSAHSTVHTGPYTAPHVILIHLFNSNQCSSLASDLIFKPNPLINHLLGYALSTA